MKNKVFTVFTECAIQKSESAKLIKVIDPDH